MLVGYVAAAGSAVAGNATPPVAGAEPVQIVGAV
jgi:hypothetical protein